MSARKIFSIAVLLVFTLVFSAQAQDKTETRVEKSDCFSGRITLNITHCTPGKKDGAISMALPRSAGNSKIFWIGFDVGKEAKKIEKIAPGYYTIVIFDGNNCSTKIEKVLVKEVK